MPSLEDSCLQFRAFLKRWPDMLIVGNRIDVRDDGSGVPREEGRSFVSKYGADCVGVSAKTGENIDELFRTVARNLHTEHMQ